MLDIKGIGGLDFYIGIILYVMTMNNLHSSDLTNDVPSTMQLAHMTKL
jgi:hypothetical protein